MNPPVLSVVTPFYNTDAYLQTCIESVLAQDFHDFEYVLLDNQSTDGSSRIAAEYAARDPRIRLAQTDEHLDQVQNYNAALRLCDPSARYVKIVQADDWLLPGCLTQMIDAAARHPHCPLVLAHYHWGDSIGATPLPPEDECFAGSLLARQQLLEKAFYFGTPTTVMYSAEYVRNRRDFFSTTRLHEDTDVCYMMARDHDIAFVHQILSVVRIDDASITGRASSFNPFILDRFLQVESHGAHFLTPDELARVRREAKREYYDALAARVIRGAEPGFWSYHRKGLATADLDIELAHVALAVARYVGSVITCPRRVVSRLRRATGTVRAQE